MFAPNSPAWSTLIILSYFDNCSGVSFNFFLVKFEQVILIIFLKHDKFIFYFADNNWFCAHKKFCFAYEKIGHHVRPRLDKEEQEIFEKVEIYDKN